MSSREERLEAAKKDSLLVGLAVGARSPSQVPKAIEDLRAMGIEFTNESEKIAKVVAQLKRDDPEKFKAIFGKVLVSQKNKESEVKKNREEVITQIKNLVREHKITSEDLGFEARSNREGRLDKKTIEDFVEKVLEKNDLANYYAEAEGKRKPDPSEEPVASKTFEEGLTNWKEKVRRKVVKELLREVRKGNVYHLTEVVVIEMLKRVVFKIQYWRGPTIP